MENICVSLDLARQLKDKGYPQESYFWWSNDVEMDGQTWGVVAVKGLYSTRQYIAAPTASEIGEKLPTELHEHFSNKAKRNVEAWLSIVKTLDNTWMCCYAEDEMSYSGFEEDTMAESMGKMYLFLIKNDLLKPNETH